MPVSLAIHISSCIPFFFKAVKHNGKTYIDGGCLKNLPLDLFINEDGKTLAFDLISDEKEKEHKIKSIKDFTAGFVNMMLLAANRIDSISEKVDVIKINTGNVSAFDFDIDSNKMEYLINAGYNAL